MGTLPNTTSEIEAGWLSEALPEDVRRGRTVTDVRAEVIGEGVGFMGEVARLHLAYDEPDTGAAPSVISKMPTVNEGFKHVGTMLGLYEKEARFYEEVAPEVEVRIPEAYCNLRDGAQWVLLLEDLAPMRPGNQLASCTREEAITALQTVARLHARWWEDPRLDDFAEWLPGPRSPYFDILKGAYLQSVQPFHDHWSLMGYIVTMANDVDMDTLDDRGRELLATMFERYSTAILDLQATDYLT